MKLMQIHPGHVCQNWPFVAHWLAPAMAHSAGEYTIDQLKVMLVSGAQALLVVIDDDGGIHGALTVATERYPEMTVALITAIGGKLISSQPLFEEFKAWATAHGHTHIRGLAHESVARLWRQRFGYREIYRTVEYAL